MTTDRPRSGSQRIPRPAEVRPGGPAPWAEWWGGEPDLDLAHVRQAIETYASKLRRRGPDEPSAAVLMPFFADDADGELHVVLTRRAQHLRAHRGEVAFPGGRREPGESPVDAACREAYEEIGLDVGLVDVVGHLDVISTASSSSTIVPVVATLPGRPELVANPGEVEAILLVPLVELLAEGVYREERWRIGPAWRGIYFFEIAGDTIWGATARLLHQFFVALMAV